MDLLLYFIKRDEINIYDIPIAKITREYLDYLNLMQTLNLKVAGEFIDMASTLMQIKARMLLPRFSNPEDEEIEDPRNELVQKLVEYQQFKELGEALQKLEYESIGHFPRKPNLAYMDTSVNAEEMLQKVTLFDILAAFKKVLDRLSEGQIPHNVTKLDVTMQEQMEFIYRHFIKKSTIRFSELVKGIEKRVVLIVTFLAILEMIHTHQIRVYQEGIFDDFIIEKVES
ncbi:MAG: segregation/condensation protein A [Candidatus Marinimicrobia bacterium]|nr:segregation/condensation protein A [Candidatus Neomarinimicrobiota bacterium]